MRHLFALSWLVALPTFVAASGPERLIDSVGALDALIRPALEREFGPVEDGVPPTDIPIDGERLSAVSLKNDLRLLAIETKLLRARWVVAKHLRLLGDVEQLAENRKVMQGSIDRIEQTVPRVLRSVPIRLKVDTGALQQVSMDLIQECDSFRAVVSSESFGTESSEPGATDNPVHAHLRLRSLLQFARTQPGV